MDHQANILYRPSGPTCKYGTSLNCTHDTIFPPNIYIKMRKQKRHPMIPWPPILLLHYMLHEWWRNSLCYQSSNKQIPIHTQWGRVVENSPKIGGPQWTHKHLLLLLVAIPLWRQGTSVEIPCRQSLPVQEWWSSIWRSMLLGQWSHLIGSPSVRGYSHPAIQHDA